LEVRVSRISSLAATSVAVSRPPADGVSTARRRYMLARLGVSPLCECDETDDWAGPMEAFYSSGAG
jgi:hypothetical protein